MSRKPNKCHIRPKKSLAIYDLRFTIYDLENSRALRGEAEQKQRGILKAWRGRGSKAAEAGGAWPFTMDDCDVRARCAGFFRIINTWEMG